MTISLNQNNHRVITVKAASAFVCLAALSACGQSAKEDFLSKINGLNSEKARFFTGDYKAVCQPVKFGDAVVYETERLSFYGVDVHSDGEYNAVDMNTFMDESSLFVDQSCQQEIATQSAKGKYQFGGENKELTLTADQLTLTAKSDDFAGALNASPGFCGFVDWKPNSPKNLLSGTCAAKMKNAHYYINSHDGDARKIDLIICTDEEMQNCQSITYDRF